MSKRTIILIVCVLAGAAIFAVAYPYVRTFGVEAGY